jgi:hypothetical protein
MTARAKKAGQRQSEIERKSRKKEKVLKNKRTTKRRKKGAEYVASHHFREVVPDCVCSNVLSLFYSR